MECIEKELFSAQRPIDIAVKRLQPVEVAGFVKGCQKIYGLITTIEPDLVFFPERGAGPMRWTLETLGAVYGTKMPSISLPLGTHLETETCKEGGLTKGEKQAVVQDAVDRALNAYGKFRKPLLIDEAQTGATICTATHLLFTNLRDRRITEVLYVIAAQDSRNQWLIKHKARGYRTLFSNRRPHIRAEMVEMPLVYTDRQVFLNHILYPTSESPAQRPLRQKIMCNQAAIELISNLALAGAKPEILDEALTFTTETSLSQWIRSLLVMVDEQIYAQKDEILYWFTRFRDCFNT